jgi:cytochrome P450
MVTSVMHIDRDIWGDDVMEFKPERWKSLKQSWNFIPFLGGRRICPAQQNVLTEVGYVITRLMQEFRALLLSSDLTGIEGRRCGFFRNVNVCC